MGYLVTVELAQFRIPKEAEQEAFETLRTVTHALRIQHSIGPLMQENWRNLDELMDEWLWKPVRTEDDSIVGLMYLGEKSGNEHALFIALAPFVTPGSFVQMRDEAGLKWRWVFDGKQCKKVYGRAVFDDNE